MQRKKVLANINFDYNYEIEEYSYLDKPLLDIINDIYIYVALVFPSSPVDVCTTIRNEAFNSVSKSQFISSRGAL